MSPKKKPRKKKIIKKKTVRKEEVDKKLKSIDLEFVKGKIGEINESDLERAVGKADEIREKVSKSGPLGRFIEDIELMISIIKDYWNRRYRKIPFWALAAIVFALLYILNPADLIPDVIPVVGLLDDAAVTAICLALVEQELHDYRKWKQDFAL